MKKKIPGTLYEFEDPCKHELEQWLVIDHRLRDVEKALTKIHRSIGRARKHRVTSKDESIAIRSYYCFAAVTYLRCFSSGRHRRLSIQEIPNLTQTNISTHDDVRDIRNTYLAHTVDDKESHEVFLKAPPGKAIDSFNTVGFVMICDSKRGLRNFMNLVGNVRNHVSSQTERVGDVIAVRFFGEGASWRHRHKS